MSDIGLPDGMVVLFGAFVTMGIGAVAMALALLIAIFGPRVGEKRSRRFLRWLPGPLACILIGALSLLLLGLGTPTICEARVKGGECTLGKIDEVWFLIPASGVLVGAAIFARAAARRRRAPREP